MHHVSETRSGIHVVNEDRLICEPSVPLFAVLDGEFARGHAADVAVAVLRDAAASIATAVARGSASVRDVLSTVVLEANRTIFANGQTPEWRGAGTTLTCVVPTENSALVAHVGDSRLYRRSSSGWQCVTVDHSLVQEARDSRQPNIAELLANHSTVITRVLGMAPHVQIDMCVLPRSSFTELLLCTDGFWRPLDPELVGGPLPDLSGPELLDWAYRAHVSDGERDDATSLVVSF